MIAALLQAHLLLLPTPPSQHLPAHPHKIVIKKKNTRSLKRHHPPKRPQKKPNLKTIINRSMMMQNAKRDYLSLNVKIKKNSNALTKQFTL